MYGQRFSFSARRVNYIEVCVLIQVTVKMNNDTTSIAGVTSRAYHTIMWILVTAGLLGNLVVLVWRCSKKESRDSLISVLIISLAIADLLFCCHFLLEEVMLAKTVFASHQENLAIYMSTTDERLCFSVLFLVGVSANAIMLTAVAIALATLFSFRLHRYGQRIITCDLLDVLFGFRRAAYLEVQIILPN